MAISHELSSEIATALFSAKERSPRELNDLKEVIFRIHSTLEQLMRDHRVAQVAHGARGAYGAYEDRPTPQSVTGKIPKDS